MGFKSEECDIFTFQQLLSISSPVWSCIVILKNEVWSHSTSEPMNMGKDPLRTIAISDYRASVENVEFSSPVQHNASLDVTRGPLKGTLNVGFLG
ncbi:hypothetical protein TNCV_3939481 [Trichonephila clavipes]|uniref:Uncharacterized protein n=1 Tax=Trichonephila clavipes TaxID=2585209 RepID=A0A8X7B9Z3_TRICX|nr:hypothetical protein TNCV_3939481 [Trichonephila clavipes]